GTTRNTVSGNYIGTDATGSVDLGNGNHGVFIFGGAQANVIGGDTPGERNIISGNEYDGVLISGSGTTSNTVSGNYIGTDASGALDLGN
ncbi:MAG: right-handed parallel beta-helix repeat-containing protein, partial [Anaerolineae bacterium]|nr:right-handed parallel beta-helix repeat-containing protein [Anaerolineae bacterium]NIN96194.1 right-handed parallel beta-helix repeat-containing protein [Anaerolineae bacterium]NIQ79218.1 right-handed parallel beta-helix repeat-containing protein [Anaerolineae bacterium]